MHWTKHASHTSRFVSYVRTRRRLLHRKDIEVIVQDPLMRRCYAQGERYQSYLKNFFQLLTLRQNGNNSQQKKQSKH